LLWAESSVSKIFKHPSDGKDRTEKRQSNSASMPTPRSFPRSKSTPLPCEPSLPPSHPSLPPHLKQRRSRTVHPCGQRPSLRRGVPPPLSCALLRRRERAREGRREGGRETGAQWREEDDLLRSSPREGGVKRPAVSCPSLPPAFLPHPATHVWASERGRRWTSSPPCTLFG